MFIRRALALSALAVATAFAADKAGPPAAFTPRDANLPPLEGRTELLTLRQAIEMALSNNLDIKWQKTDIRFQDAQVRLAWGDFDPAFSLDSTYEFIRTPQNPTTITTADTAQQILLQQEALAQIQSAIASQPTPAPLPSAAPSPTATPAIAVSTAPYIFQNEDLRNSVGLQGKFPLGTTYKIGIEADHLRDTVLNLNENFLPSDVFFAGFTLDQPILQGFGFDANLVNVRVSRRNRQVSFNNWCQRVIDSVATTISAYIDMSYAQALMRVRRDSMEADRLLAEGNQHRVDVGLMTPIDVRQAEVDVSADQDDLLTAKNFLTSRVADLKKMIFRGVQDDDGRTFLAADSPDLPIPVLDRENLLADAFQNRVDYATAIQQAEIQNLQLKYYRNQLLPKIDFVATLGVNGLSTTSSAKSASSAFNGQAPEWIFSLQGSIPIGNVAARANLASSLRLREEALLKLSQIELSIHTDVDTAISAIRTNQERVQTARKAVQFAQDVVRAQDRRIEEGQASTFDILDSRRRLYDGQSRELAAINDLNRSILQLYLATGTLLRLENIDLAADDPSAPRSHPSH